MTHTPLPWTLIHSKINQGMQWQVCADFKDIKNYFTIAAIKSSGGNSPHRVEANAQFIVNACNSFYTHLAEIDMLKEKNKELLDLLELILKEPDPCIGGDDFKPFSAAHDEVTRQCSTSDDGYFTSTNGIVKVVIKAWQETFSQKAKEAIARNKGDV